MLIKYSKKFKRDYQREKSGVYGKKINAMLSEVIDILSGNQAFPRRYFDHALSGEWQDCRDCHLKPDLVLIYRKLDAGVIELVRLGSHSELGF